MSIKHPLAAQPRPGHEFATLGGGCFWCLEAVFELVSGVDKVVSGYAGGQMDNPDYRSVCTGQTGHAEVVQVSFDPSVVSYRELLDLFFGVHDPTTLNRQGADVGTQYRSAIFFQEESQKKTAEAVKARVERSGKWGKPLVTEIAPFTTFVRAEDYHQKYLVKHPRGYTCHFIRKMEF